MKVISQTSIDNAIWDIKGKLWRKYPIDESDRYISPLVRYISTGRASTEFLKVFINLTERQKTSVASRLVKHYGNDDKAIDSVCQCIGYERE